MSVKSLTVLAVLIALACGVVLLRGRDKVPPQSEPPPPVASQEDAAEETAGTPASAQGPPAAAREEVSVERAGELAGPPPLPAAPATPDGLFVRGRVLSPTGEGVPGATVCIGSVAALEELLARGEPAEELRQVRTDDVGRFRLEGLESGVLRLVAGGAQYAPSEELLLELGGDTAGEEVELWLRAGARIYGEILRIDGAPMGETSLRLLQKVTGIMRLGTTDAEGRFDERWLNAGEWELVCIPDASIVEELGGSIVDHLS